MTDTTHVNNVYYDVLQYNNTNDQVAANSDTKLIYPLFNDANNYSVAINKAQMDLSTIPLSQKNIGLKEYEVGLKVGTTEEFGYVRQINSNSDNYVWNCAPNSTVITKYTYSPTGLTEVSSQDVSAITPNVNQFVVDDYTNIYIIGGTVANYPDTLYIVDIESNLLYSKKFTFLKNIFIDRGQNLYICDESSIPTVYIYSNNNEIGVVSLTQIATLTQNKAGNPLVNLVFCVADDEIIVGYNTNTVTLYNNNYEPQTDIVETSIFQLENKANINTEAGTYITSSSDRINDTLWGTASNQVYDVNTDSQLTTGTIESPLVYVNVGYGFAIGADGYTYATPYPATPPTAFFSVNGVSRLSAGCIWSIPHLNSITGISYTAKELLSFNFGIGFGSPTTPNTYISVGEVEFNNPATIFPTSVDVNPVTHKLVATGTDDNLYQSTYPIAAIEYILIGSGTDNPTMCGLDVTDPSGNQITFQTRTFNDLIKNMVCMFRYLQEYYTFYSTSPTSYNLVIRDALTFNVMSTVTAFDTSVLNATFLPTSGYFVYYNANTSEIHYVSAPLTINLSIAANDYVVAFCDLQTAYFAVAYPNSIAIYTVISAALVQVATFPISNVVDIASDTGNIVNGASTLLLLSGSGTPNQAEVLSSYTFTDATYTVLETPTVLYTAPSFPTTYLNSVNCHKLSGRVMITSTSTASEQTNVITLCRFNNYSTAYQINGVIPIPTGGNYICNKYTAFLNQTTTSTKIWSVIPTNGVNVKSVSVSKSNPNNLYCISSTDSHIYNGNLVGGVCPLSILTLFATQTYDYISNILNTSTAYNSTLYLYNTLNGQQLITQLALNDQVGAIARNDTANQYVISSKNNNLINVLNPNTLVSTYTQALVGAFNIFTKNGSDIDAGDATIYNISSLLDAINDAFMVATTRINQALGAGTVATPPILTLNYQSGLCTLSYPQTLSTSGNGILFNQNLLNLIYFQSALDTQSGLNLLKLNAQAESITQNSKTIYQFNQLSRILFVSNTIFVIGAYYGINSFSHIITDIDVVTSDFVENLGQRLYYQPNFLRSYFMNSNLPVDRMQLQILYEYRDGTQYPLLINPSQNMSVKIQFIRKF